MSASEEIAVVDEAVAAPTTMNLFEAPDPESVIIRAAEIAKPLEKVARKQGLIVRIGKADYPKVEAWTLLGSMLGVFPYCVWTRKLENGWEARVEARTRDGSIVGGAEAQCTRDESTWRSRDDFALRSMAQTRATSRALRQPLGFVMTLAGFEATAAEEMPTVAEGRAQRKPVPPVEQTVAKSYANSSGDTLTEAQHKLIERLLNVLALDRDAFKAQVGVDHMTEITKAEASRLIEELKELEQAADAQLPEALRP